MRQRVPARVECHHVRSADTSGGQHAEHGYRSVNSLTVDDVPPATPSDHTGDTRGKVVIPTARPRRNAQHGGAVDNLPSGTTACPVGGQDGDLEVASFSQ